jgi:choline kinase
MDKLKDCFILLLSAGKGTRMGKAGRKIPKTLLKLKEKTILSRLIQNLKSRGANEINIILGYKHKKILQELKASDIPKINYVTIKDYLNNGSVYSLYRSKKLWEKSKKKFVLMMHTDLVFDPKFIDNILKSKKKNIIGLRTLKGKKYKMESFVGAVDKSMRIIKIGKNKEIIKPYGEILCINKFSKKTFVQLIEYLKNYFKKFSTNITWEYPMSDFANKVSLYGLKNQSFKWVNVNRPSDLGLAKKGFNI